MSAGFDLAQLDLSIDAEGQWCHQGVAITHAGLQAFLFRSLKKMGPAYMVCADGLCIPVRIADCPLVVLAVRHLADRIDLSLTDGSVAPLDPDTLTIDAENVPRCVVGPDAFTARFSRPAWLQLAEAIEETPAGGFALRVGAAAHPVRLAE